MRTIPLFVGFDQREAVVYHTFVQSVLEHASEPISITPLHTNALHGFDGKRDGSNAFIYSRFLVPYLCGFKGYAIFADGDMVCQADIVELWAKCDPYMAVQVVKHEYQTRHPKKYLGAANDDYPRKNWSSLILWNCEHFANRRLLPEKVATMSGPELHRFSWIPDDRIGALDPAWNHLVYEYPDNPEAKLLHYTIGAPCFEEYRNCPHAEAWHRASRRMLEPSR